MRKIILFLIAVISLSSREFVQRRTIKGNGELKRVTKNISRADRIKISGGIDVVVTKGSSRIEIEADENLIKYIQVRNHDGWLEIKTRKGYNLRSENDITVYVSTDMLRALQVSGSSNVRSDEDWSANNTFKLDVSGSGNIVLNVNARNVEANISGSGNIDLAGESDDLSIDISGSGNFKGYALRCNRVDLDVAGSGEAEVFAEERLKVSIAGSGDVKYKGNATVSKSIAGSGSVEKMD